MIVVQQKNIRKKSLNKLSLRSKLKHGTSTSQQPLISKLFSNISGGWILMRCHHWHRESMSSMLREISASSLTTNCRCQHRFQPCVEGPTSCYQLRQLHPLVRCLSEDVAKILVQAFIVTRLDYCNTLYFGIADGLMSRLLCSQFRTPPHVSSPESGGASTSRQPYVSCTGCQSADEWISRYPPVSIVRWLAPLLST